MVFAERVIAFLLISKRSFQHLADDSRWTGALPFFMILIAATISYIVQYYT